MVFLKQPYTYFTPTLCMTKRYLPDPLPAPHPKPSLREKLFPQICADRISLCYNAAIMLQNFHFANNNNDNDDGQIVGRSFAN